MTVLREPVYPSSPSSSLIPRDSENPNPVQACGSWDGINTGKKSSKLRFLTGFCKNLLIVLVLLLQGVLSSGQPMLIQDFAKDQDIKISYNPVLNQLMLFNQTRILVVSPGRDQGLLNGSIPVSISGIRYDGNGAMVIEQEARTIVSNLLIPRDTLSQGRKIGAIYIDPGHGGRDPGAVGRHTVDSSVKTLQEKDVVLAVGQQVASALGHAYPSMQIILSRNTDEYLTLEERTSKANEIELQENESILFVSIHANAAINSRARGFEVWYLPPEFRRQLIGPGDREVLSDSVLPILNSILEEEITVESILLAQSISQGLEQLIGPSSPNRGLFEEEWYVVRNARMPSVLVEVGFVTNKDEFLLLSNPSYLNKISQGIYNGIINYIDNFESVK